MFRHIGNALLNFKDINTLNAKKFIQKQNLIVSFLL